MPWSVTTEPTTEPLTTAEAKSHLRVVIDTEDTDIAAMVVAARKIAERRTGRAFVTQTVTMKLDRLDELLEDGAIPMLPLASVTSIAYLDSNGDSQTLASTQYVVDAVSLPARIRPAYGVVWPQTRDQINAVTVVLVVGYGAASAVPADIKHAIRLILGSLYEYREDFISGTIIAEIPRAANALLDSYRIPAAMAAV